MYKIEVIPKLLEESGIWQGGSPSFLFRASDIVHRQGTSAGRKTWSKADAAKNRFFRLFRYILPKLSGLLNGRFRGYSVERLMHFLTELGKDVDIIVRSKPRYRKARVSVSGSMERW